MKIWKAGTFAILAQYIICLTGLGLLFSKAASSYRFKVSQLKGGKLSSMLNFLHSHLMNMKWYGSHCFLSIFSVSSKLLAMYNLCTYNGRWSFSHQFRFEVNQ